MRRPAVSGIGLLLTCIALTTALTSRAQPQQAVPASSLQVPASTKAPVYVLLETTIDEDINLPYAMDRLPRALQVIEKLQARAPALHPVCLVQFNGVTANLLGAENSATKMVDRVKESARRGLIEIGYDGTEEPNFVMRPRPNMRGANLPEERWMARLQADQWFLTEWKQPITGEPDPSRSGGFKRVQEVFGRVAFARGVTFEPWYAADVVHALDALHERPVLVGFLEPTTYPARNFDGYRVGSPALSDRLSPDERCAPEVFWLDTALHLSDYGTLGGRVFNAYEGPEALAKYIGSLDRSRLHVVQVRLGHPAVYMKPGFGARNYQTPLEHAYDNPKAPNLPPAALRTADERAAAYAQEDAVLDWLVTKFFPENPGSRFVSIQQLAEQASAGMSDPVTPTELRDAASKLIGPTQTAAVELPPFVQVGNRFFSMADLFGLLTAALADVSGQGARTASIQPRVLFGPLGIEDVDQVTGVRVPIAALTRECVALMRERFTNAQWTPVPRNAVPAFLTVGSVRLTAAQLLRAMAEAYLAPIGTTEVEVGWVRGASPIAGNLPPTRPPSERGGVWTAKPATIRFKN